MIQTYKHRNSIFTVFVVLLGLAVYWNSLRGEFLWDDHHFITNNIHIKNLKFLPQIFTQPIASGSFGAALYYRPLQEVTYLIDYHFWHNNVAGYHLTNVLLHLGAALLVYRLVSLLNPNFYFAALVSLLFLIHPVHVEAVAALSGRGEPLAAIFMLTAMIYYLRNLESPQLKYSALIFTAYTLALFTKENTLTFCLFPLIYHFCYKKKVSWKYFAPLVLSLAVYATFRVLFTKAHPLFAQQIAGGLNRLPGFFDAFTQYIRLFIAPTDLHFDYGQPILGWFHPTVVTGIAGLISFIILALRSNGRNALLSFGIFWYLAGLIPYTNVYLLYSYMAEHYLYFPSIGFFITFVYLIWPFLKLGRRLTHFAVIILLSVYALVSVLQNNYWHNALDFLKTTIKYNPNSWVLYNNLGVEYSRQGDRESEINAYQKSIQLNPNYALAYRNQGIAHLDLGELQPAELYLEHAVTLNPTDLKSYNALGVVYQRMGKTQEAVTALEQALALSPNFPWGYNNLGVLYGQLKDYEKAVVYLEKAVNLDPNYAEGYFNLGAIYFTIGKRDEAVGALKKAVTIEPRHEKAKELLKELEGR